MTEDNQDIPTPPRLTKKQKLRVDLLRAKKVKPKTRGERMICFIERYLRIPEGNRVGQRVVLDPFQLKFIFCVYDNPFITDTAILSIARKNAKTGLIAFLVLGHTVGPEAKRNSRIISGAQSREQAAEVYNLASKCAVISPKISGIVRCIPSVKKIIGLPMNVEYQATSADAKTAHGKSPILAILDEVGQIRGPQSDFVDAITTAQGAYEDPLLIYISTQAANDADLFSVVIDDAVINEPPKTVCHVYAADKECKVLDEVQWTKANPGLGTIRMLKDMVKQAKKASRMPSFENTFRNLNLNQRVSAESTLFSRSSWKACQLKAIPKIEECERYFGGLDLSGRKDLTSLILLGELDKQFFIYPYFWTPEFGLVDRAKTDRAPYDLWRDKGLIRTTPGKVIKFNHIAGDLGEIFSGLKKGNEPFEPEGIHFDRWRIEDLRDELEEIGLEELPLLECGQGFKDMSPCIDALEEMLLNGELFHDGNPVLTMCAANAIVTTDPTESRKFNKKLATGRIDGMVGLAMAAGLAKKRTETATTDIQGFLDNPIVIK
jgi:phage terminase large subunit-like protein